MPARAANLAQLDAALDRFWQCVDQLETGTPRQFDGDQRVRFHIALGEVGANIVRHAHAGGTIPGHISLRLTAYANRVEARLADGGLAYRGRRPALGSDRSDLPRATAESEHPPGAPGAPPEDQPEDAPATVPDALVFALPESGYGLALVQACVDHVEYTRTARGQNRWLLIVFEPAT